MTTVTVKTSELVGAALDWAVAQALGGEYKAHRFGDNKDAPVFNAWVFPNGMAATNWRPSTDWSQCGPLVAKHRVSIIYSDEVCDPCAWTDDTAAWHGETPLVAACRAIVAAKLGDTVEVPGELL